MVLNWDERGGDIINLKGDEKKKPDEGGKVREGAVPRLRRERKGTMDLERCQIGFWGRGTSVGFTWISTGRV